MHSRIFQIEDRPVIAEDRFGEDLVPEWFTNSIADYVTDIGDESREDEIEWLMTTAFGTVCTRDGDKITFNIDTGSFFDGSFERFKEALTELMKIDINQFISNRSVAHKRSLSSLMYQLNDAYEDKYEFYVWHDDELYTMASWMRQVKPLGVYYLGGVVDYHF